MGWLVLWVISAMMLCGLEWRSWDLKGGFLLALDDRRVDMVGSVHLWFFLFLSLKFWAV